MPTGPKGQKRPADVIGNAVKTLRMTPAMAAGVTGELWEISDIVALIEAKEAERPMVARGSYRKRENLAN